jgi:hypothetical protein
VLHGLARCHGKRVAQAERRCGSHEAALWAGARGP